MAGALSPPTGYADFTSARPESDWVASCMLLWATRLDTKDLFADAGFVAQLQRLLRARANGHFPALRAHADDLVSQTLQDLWRFAARRPELFGKLEPSVGGELIGEAWDGVCRIALAILSRRAADLYRHEAARWAKESLTEATDDVALAVQSDDPSLPRHLLLRQMLKVCIAELAHFSPEDRETLWTIVGESGDRSLPRTEAERQRLSRLRKRLAAAIHKHLGESAKSLLATDLRDE